MSQVVVAKPKKQTAPSIRAMKGKKAIVSIAAYTAPIARILEDRADLILVGDSLGMAIYGMSSTVGVTLEMMITHGRAVVNAAPTPCVMVDMPFGTYERSCEQAFENASRIMMETGCDAVKLEGGQTIAPTIAFLTARGIPVCGHIGLQPQLMKTLGGFITQGKSSDSAEQILADAKAIEEAGVFAMVVEAVPETLGKEITKTVNVPTIGIGGGRYCDGQILLIDDLTGLLTDFKPKFIKRYADLAGEITKSVDSFASDIRAGAFPGVDQVY